MIAFVFGIIFVRLMNLHGRILGVNLPFNKTLQCFWYPDIKADLPIDGSDFETDVLLDAARESQLLFVAQNAVKAGKELLSGKLFLVVGFWNFEDE